MTPLLPIRLTFPLCDSSYRGLEDDVPVPSVVRIMAGFGATYRSMKRREILRSVHYYCLYTALSITVQC